MILFYVDEFGNHDADRVRAPTGEWLPTPGSSDWFLLSAVGVKETARASLAKELIAVKDRYFPGWQTGTWKDSEIKGRHITKTAASFANGVPNRGPGRWGSLNHTQVSDLVEDIGRLFRKFRPMIYVVAIDRKALANRSRRHSPLGVAYTFLQQRLALMNQHGFGGSEGVLIIADEQSAHEKYFRTGELANLRGSFTQGLPMQPDFNLILDKPVWIDPNLNEYDREIIQLADIVAYSSAQAVMRNVVPNEPWLLWSAISPCLMSHWKQATARNGGFSIWPRPAAGYPTGLG